MVFQKINELNGTLSEKTELLAKKGNELHESQCENKILRDQKDHLIIRYQDVEKVRYLNMVIITIESLDKLRKNVLTVV